MSRLAPLAALALAAAVPAVRGADYEDPDITAADRAHWAYQPVKRPAVPDATTNPIDAFVRAKLAEKGLEPSPEADRLTLIRRVTLDLTGLPPTPAEVDVFLKDNRPDAYERVVDRLLASPHYGERQAQHWLDVVRFAESNGYEMDGDRPHAWRYRDYVVRSFNADKPYDVFLTEQVAGDELAAGKEPREAADLWAATGMHRCGPIHVVSGNLDQEMIRQELLTEMVNGLGAAALGLTMGCARCHDHKFDPISQGDYYRLQAYFAGTKYADVNLATDEEKEARKKAVAALEAEAAPLKKRVAEIDAPVREKLTAAKRAALEPKYREALDTPKEKRTAEQKKLAADAGTLLQVRWDEVLDALPADLRAERAAIRETLHAIEAKMPPPAPAAWAIKNDGEPKTHVLKRGSTKHKWGVVGPAAPRVLVSADAEVKTRTQLARWLTRADHPLTARVMVNRLWQHHFGRGIVGSPNDFGTRGDRPTHPELLDWLAAELVEPTVLASGGREPPDKSGNQGAHAPRSPKAWSLKRMHRLMVTSAAYRQASAPRPDDPENKLFSRMPRRRLEAESLRDSILAAAGSLNRKAGGPSVRVPLEPEVYDLIFTEGEPDGLWPVTPDATEHVRRSIYLLAKRNVRLPLFEAFDQPDTLNSCADRPVSTFAPQALILMNGPFVHEQGLAMARSLVREAGDDPAKQLAAMYRRTLGRSPTDAETKLGREFLAGQGVVIRDARPTRSLFAAGVPLTDAEVRTRALADLCAVLFNTTEFVTRP
ncbi:MAG: DUF1549 and DUF1553 domain-containing protein [Gemmataceae bacterium]|nr:DUF1549 and DUF1553 domain-containing protein [Gemmataceae bacterium]